MHLTFLTLFPWQNPFPSLHGFPSLCLNCSMLASVWSNQSSSLLSCNKALYYFCTTVTILNWSSTWSIFSLATPAFPVEYIKSFTAPKFLLNLLYSLFLFSSSWDDWYYNQCAVHFFFPHRPVHFITQDEVTFGLCPHDTWPALTNAWSSNYLKDSTVPNWSDTIFATKVPVSKSPLIDIFLTKSVRISTLYYCMLLKFMSMGHWDARGASNWF